jgi:hypothetical protein
MKAGRLLTDLVDELDLERDGWRCDCRRIRPAIGIGGCEPSDAACHSDGEVTERVSLSSSGPDRPTASRQDRDWLTEPIRR